MTEKIHNRLERHFLNIPHIKRMTINLEKTRKNVKEIIKIAELNFSEKY